MEILKEHQDGLHKVAISDYDYGLSLRVMRNGWQWTCTQLDPVTIELIEAALAEYRASVEGAEL